jgi:putative tricarboxylic transport membrane protein
MTFAFGIVGFLLKKFGFETPPLILAFVLGPLVERSFRQSLMMSGGNFSIFITQPISAVFILAAVGVIITAFIKKKPFAKGIEMEN